MGQMDPAVEKLFAAMASSDAYVEEVAEAAMKLADGDSGVDSDEEAAVVMRCRELLTSAPVIPYDHCPSAELISRVAGELGLILVNTGRRWRWVSGDDSTTNEQS